MATHNWCHNPDCHTIRTQSRIRGSGDNKVLRTIKIKVGRYNWNNDNSPNIWDYFCNNNCLFSFLGKFAREVANLNPTTKPSETPIKIEKEKYESHKYEWNNDEQRRVPYMATRTTIKEANNE